MKTNQKQLNALKAAKENATKEFNKYQKAFNEEHGIKNRTIIQEIITLHKKGVPNADIIAKGYNKWTVREQVRLFSKGKRVAKTIVAKFLPAKEKK